jgi:hypothetical protein
MQREDREALARVTEDAAMSMRRSGLRTPREPGPGSGRNLSAIRAYMGVIVTGLPGPRR